MAELFEWSAVVDGQEIEVLAERRRVGDVIYLDDIAVYPASGASIKATAERLGVSLAEAKRIVHVSAAWADVRSANDSFHQALDEAASSGG